MVDRIGEGSSLARAAIESALKRHSEAVSRVSQALEGEATQATAPAEFSNKLTEQIRNVDAAAKAPDQLVLDVAAGKIQDFHEVAASLKTSELSFKFALEVRNKLIDAYREVMRMGV